MKLKNANNVYFLAILAVTVTNSCKPLDPKPDFTKGFIKFYTGLDYTYASKLVITNDGGYAMIGSGLSANGSEDMYVVKTDNKGNKMWDSYLGTVNGDTGYAIKEDANSNLIVLGTANAGEGQKSNFFLAKLESKTGAIAWTNSYNPNMQSLFGYDVLLSEATSKITMVGSQLNGANRREFILIQADNDGNLTSIGQQNSYNYSISGANFIPNSILLADNSDFVCVSSTDNNFQDGSPQGTPYLYEFRLTSTSPVNAKVKTDIYNSNTIAGADLKNVISSSQAKKVTGGYIIVGTSIKNGNTDAYLLKVDNDFNLLWFKVYSVLGNEYGYAVEATSDGGFILTGRKDISFSGNLTTSNTDIFVTKTDSNGEVTWSKDFGGDGADFATDIKETKDGGYIILASMSLITTPQNKLQMALIKIGATGLIEN